MRTNRIRLAIVLLVVGTGGCVSGHASVAQAGFGPGLIAYDDAQNGIFINGKLIYSTPGAGAGALRGWPMWSPNGLELAFSATDPPLGTGGVKIVLTDRKGRVIATPLRHSTLSSPAGAAEGALDWSPNGKQIAYECAPDDTVTFPGGGTPPNVCVLDVATGAQRLLAFSTDQTPLPYIYEDAISWSPHGNVIAVDLVPTAPCPPGTPTLPPGQPPLVRHESDIGLIDVATGAITVLAKGASDAEFSPDGNKIVFVSGAGVAGRPAGVDIMSAAGTFIRQVVPPEHAKGGFRVGPTWSPDAKKILFSTRTDGANNGNTDFFTVSVHGGPLSRVTSDPNDDLDGDWAPLVTTCTVPKLKGQTLAKAKTLIKRAGCVLGKVTGPKKNRGARHVVNQKPGANKDVATGTKVNVQIR